MDETTGVKSIPSAEGATSARGAASAGEEIVDGGWERGRLGAVSFGINKSRRYHAMLRDHYRGVYQVIVAANALAGTSTFVAVFAQALYLGQIFAGIIAIASTLDLVFGFSKKADQHENLCRRFTELAADLIEWKPTESNYQRACSARIRIEKDEPVVLRLIDLLAQNEEARARGSSEDELVPINRLQRSFGYYATFGIKDIENWKRQKETKRLA